MKPNWKSKSPSERYWSFILNGIINGLNNAYHIILQAVYCWRLNFQTGAAILFIGNGILILSVERKRPDERFSVQRISFFSLVHSL